MDIPFEIVHTGPQNDVCTIRMRWPESTTPQEREHDVRLLRAVIESMVREWELIVAEPMITDPPKLTYDDIRMAYGLMAKRGY